MYTASARIHRAAAPAESRIETYDTRYGQATLVWRDGKIVSHELPPLVNAQGGAPNEVSRLDAAFSSGGKSPLAEMLVRYFAGERVDFGDDPPFSRKGWSDFALAVAEALLSVPYGKTVSYAGLAAAAGRPRAQRAVGGFLARNPFPVILPCHRVIQSDGGIGGFSSGRQWKMLLLELEGFLR